MAKKDASTKTAWIGAIGPVLGALIAGAFLLCSKKAAVAPPPPVAAPAPVPPPAPPAPPAPAVHDAAPPSPPALPPINIDQHGHDNKQKNYFNLVPPEGTVLVTVKPKYKPDPWHPIDVSGTSCASDFGLFAPGTETSARVGKHKITCTLDGYFPEKRTIAVRKNRPAQITIGMEARKGWLSFNPVDESGKPLGSFHRCAVDDGGRESGGHYDSLPAHTTVKVACETVVYEPPGPDGKPREKWMLGESVAIPILGGTMNVATVKVSPERQASR